MNNPFAPDEDLVTIARFTSLLEFDIARGLLESEGIECLGPEEHLVGLTGGQYVLGVGGMRLQVRSSDVERATQLLADVDEAATSFSGNP